MSTDGKKEIRGFSPKELGQRVALALVEELEFAFPKNPRPGDKNKWIQELLDEPPHRDRLKFQTTTAEGSEKIHTAQKEVLSKDISDNIEGKVEIENIFCEVHGGFTYIPGVDVDHSVSYNEMEANIVKLWNYLNDPIGM